MVNLDRAFKVVQAREHNTSLAAVASINLLTTLMPQDRVSELIAQLAEHTYRLLNREAPIPSMPRNQSELEGSRDLARHSNQHGGAVKWIRGERATLSNLSFADESFP